MAVGEVDEEQFAAALLGRVRAALGSPAVAYRRGLKALAGGKFSSVYAFELEPRPEGWAGAFVARRVGPSDQTLLEGGLHEAATSADLSAPRLLLCEPDASELGGGVLVMERIPGRTYLRGAEPWRFALDLPKLLAAWPRRLRGVLSSLQSINVDQARTVLARHGVPEELARPGRHLRHVSAILSQEPSWAWLVEWLQDKGPSAPDRLALVHGDLWPGNVLIGRDGVRLIDWTRGGIDDPALDVGFAKVAFALMPEPFPPPPPFRQVAHLAGWSIAGRISARCDELVGGAERVRYYEVLRCAVELADVIAARAAGTRPGWGHGVPALVRHIGGITGVAGGTGAAATPA